MSRQNYLMAERYIRPFGNALRDMFTDRSLQGVNQHFNQMAANPVGGIDGDFRQRMATASMLGFPVVSDVAGLAADAAMYKDNPQERTIGNFLLTGFGALPFVPGMTAWHGSPHKFDKFELSNKTIGTGEGAQAYGHGLYFAEDPKVAGSYRSQLAAVPKVDEVLGRLGVRDKELASYVSARLAAEGDPIKTANGLEGFAKTMDDAPEDAARVRMVAKHMRENPQEWTGKSGHLYNVDIPDEQIAKMLDWDAPLSEQPEAIRKLIPIMQKSIDEEFTTLKDINKATGQDLYAALTDESLNWKTGTGISHAETQAAASKRLKELGIPGIRYLDGSSRGQGKGTRNFVVFDDSILKILKRE